MEPSRQAVRRRGIVSKMVVIPLAIVLGAGLYVVIGGMTGFCPICVAILDAFDGGEQQAVPVSMKNDGFTGIKAGHVDGLVFTDLDGVEVPLSRFAGRPMLIEVWATWCAPCRKVRKQLKSIAGELAEHGVVLSLSVDRGGADVVREHIRAREGGSSPFIELLATDPNFNRVIKPKDLQPTIPKLIFVDRNGVIVDIEYGLSDPSWVIGRMRALDASGTKG